MSRRLLKTLDELDATTKLSTFIIAVLAGVLNYAGVALTLVPADDAGWWKALAAAIAIGVTVGINLGWLYILTIIPELYRARERLIGFMLMASFCGVLFGMSCWWSATALGWLEAKMLDLQDGITMANDAVDNERLQVTYVDQVLPDLRLFHEELMSLRDREARGEISGKAGCSGVCQTIASFAQRVDTLIKEAEKARSSLPAKLEETESILSELRLLGHDSKADLDDRFASAGDLVTQLNTVLAATRNLRIVSTVRRSMEDMTASFVPSAVDSQKQVDAMKAIVQSVRQQAAKIAARAAEVEALPSIDKIVIQRHNAMTAVIVHYKSLLPHWLTGIGIDFLPVLIVALRTLSVISVRREERSVQEGQPSVITLAETNEVIRQINELNRLTLHAAPLQIESRADTAKPKRRGPGRPRKADRSTTSGRRPVGRPKKENKKGRPHTSGTKGEAA